MFSSEEAKRFFEEIVRTFLKNICRRSANTRKTAHPWLTERSEGAQRKYEAQGTEQEAAATRECGDILLEKYDNFLFLFTCGEDGSLFVAAATKAVDRCARRLYCTQWNTRVPTGNSQFLLYPKYSHC